MVINSGPNKKYVGIGTDTPTCELDVNGKIMQVGNTNKMIFNVNFIVAYLSKYMSLQAGDIITTGTPPGVGMGMKPQVFLKAGDTLTLSIEHLGKQKSKVVFE